MLDATVDVFRLLRYERACVDAVIGSMVSVPHGWRSDPRWERAVVLLGHVAAALELWCMRCGGATQPPPTPFPAPAPLETIARRLHAAIDAWEYLLATKTGAELDQTISYITTTGAEFANTVGDTVLHLFGHGLYHRGQIALLVRQRGGTPAATDFVFWARQFEWR